MNINSIRTSIDSGLQTISSTSGRQGAVAAESSTRAATLNKALDSFQNIDSKSTTRSTASMPVSEAASYPGPAAFLAKTKTNAAAGAVLQKLNSSETRSKNVANGLLKGVGAARTGVAGLLEDRSIIVVGGKNAKGQDRGIIVVGGKTATTGAEDRGIIIVSGKGPGAAAAAERGIIIVGGRDRLQERGIIVVGGKQQQAIAGGAGQALQRRGIIVVGGRDQQNSRQAVILPRLGSKFLGAASSQSSEPEQPQSPVRAAEALDSALAKLTSVLQRSVGFDPGSALSMRAISDRA